jgi:hypothetical protein
VISAPTLDVGDERKLEQVLPGRQSTRSAQSAGETRCRALGSRSR